MTDTAAVCETRSRPPATRTGAHRWDCMLILLSTEQVHRLLYEVAAYPGFLASAISTHSA